MKLADNTELTEQSIMIHNSEAGKASISAANTLAVHSEQAAPVIRVAREDLTSFFTVGIVINIVMITAYFIWAYKQWGKTNARALRQAQDDPSTGSG